MEVEHVKRAANMLLMAASLVTEAEKVMDKEGFLLCNPLKNISFNATGFQFVGKNCFVKYSVEELAELLGEKIEILDESRIGINYNGVRFYRLLEEEEKNNNGTEE